LVAEKGCLVHLEWAAATEADINQIIEYYAGISPALATELVERIATAPKQLLDFPFIGPETDVEGLRKWRVARTPFLLLYVVERDRVLIVRVVDARSNWQATDE
jgi:toxin ParE1/3/4